MCVVYTKNQFMKLASNRNEYQEYSWNILGGKGQSARRADNLGTIYEPIV
jgi:hypothetical protein